MMIYYSALSAIAVICFILSAFIIDEIEWMDLDAYNCCANAMALLSLMPTAGIYLANNSPISKSKSIRIAINVISFVAMPFCLVLCGLYAWDWTNFSNELVSALIFSYVATTANQFYMAKESSYVEEDADASGIAAKALSFAKRILGKIGRFKDEHHDAYLIISTIICTLLSGLAVALIVFVISVVVGIFVIGLIGLIVIGLLNNSNSKPSRSKIYEVWEDGYKRTLTYKAYIIGKGDRYVDDRGDYWITEDDGKTFYREF